MIYKIIEDINKAIENEAYLSALSLLLTLPDICGQAEFGGRVGDRYKKWVNKYITPFEKTDDEDEDEDKNDFSYINGEMLYNLRCNVLHQGTPDIDGESNNVKMPSKFVIIASKPNKYGVYADLTYKDECDKDYTYVVNLNRLYILITQNAISCYEKNTEAFSFMRKEILTIKK